MEIVTYYSILIIAIFIKEYVDIDVSAISLPP